MTNTSAAEILSAVRGRLEKAREWKDQCAKASELRSLGWICAAPGQLLSGLAALALTSAEEALRAEEERQAANVELERAAQERLHEAKVQEKYGLSGKELAAKMRELKR